MNVHEEFLSKVHLFKFFLIAFIVIISGNVGVYGWLFHLGRACAVGIYLPKLSFDNNNIRLMY